MAFNEFDFTSGDQIEVGLLGEHTADKTDSVLRRSFLPAVVGSAEVGACSQDSVCPLMLDVLRAVVVRDGTSGVRWILGQRPCDGSVGVMSSSLFHLGDSREPTLSLNGDVQRCHTLSRDDGISLPVTESRYSGTGEHVSRALRDGDSLWNMQTSMGMAVSFPLPSPVCSCKVGNQVFHSTNTRVVEVLVDGFMANAQVRVIDCQSSCNVFWRPSQCELTLDVATDPGIFQPWTLVSSTRPLFGSLLCPVSKVDVVHRGFVPPEFS